MLYSLLLIAALAVFIFLGKRLKSLPPEKSKAIYMKYGLWFLAIVLLLLVVSGRAHWLMGVLAGLMAVMHRLLEFSRFIPIFGKLFNKQADSQPQPPTTAMSRQQAADTLGVDINATEQEITLAHKRLMQKLHPDRGGSTTLAAQINQAKDVLLG